MLHDEHCLFDLHSLCHVDLVLEPRKSEAERPESLQISLIVFKLFVPSQCKYSYQNICNLY